jgi:hypothetical protein
MGRKGSSLLELGIILFIVSLVIGIASTTVSGYRKIVLITNEQKMITADMDYLQTYAKAKHVDTDVLFYYNPYVLRAGDTVLKEVYLSKGFSTAPQHFGFTSEGASRYAGTLDLSYQKIEVGKLTVAVGSGLRQWKKIS